MWLLVGLGNPGAEYARNRHNVGFRVLDRLAERAKNQVIWKDKFGATLAEATFAATGPEKVLLCKPQEFMNVSGQAVNRVASFWKIPPAQIVVVYDELDLPFGRFRIAQGGGHGGHNGVRSLIAELPDAAFARVRFGIGRPPAGREAAGWVLANFSKEEEAALPDLVERASDALLAVTTHGPTAAMNNFNGNASPGGGRRNPPATGPQRPRPPQPPSEPASRSTPAEKATGESPPEGVASARPPKLLH
jgi:PTH1 family peptidyl-tRNA hydrolase